ncbi:hypothetical protein BHE74_00055859 [Ensete ventricosum]|nr:hypothetical protein BHE74_00055859 [Ensete ventricosum]
MKEQLKKIGEATTKMLLEMEGRNRRWRFVAALAEAEGFGRSGSVKVVTIEKVEMMALAMEEGSTLVTNTLFFICDYGEAEEAATSAWGVTNGDCGYDCYDPREVIMGLGRQRWCY